MAHYIWRSCYVEIKRTIVGFKLWYHKHGFHDNEFSKIYIQRTLAFEHYYDRLKIKQYYCAVSLYKTNSQVNTFRKKEITRTSGYLNCYFEYERNRYTITLALLSKIGHTRYATNAKLKRNSDNNYTATLTFCKRSMFFFGFYEIMVLLSSVRGQIVDFS